MASQPEADALSFAKTTEESLSLEMRNASRWGELSMFGFSHGWNLWKPYYMVPGPRKVSFFSEAIDALEDVIRKTPKRVINCDGVETVVEDMQLVTLTAERRIIASLRFPSIQERNAFILGARPLIQSPTMDIVEKRVSLFDSCKEIIACLSPRTLPVSPRYGPGYACDEKSQLMSSTSAVVNSTFGNSHEKACIFESKQDLKGTSVPVPNLACLTQDRLPTFGNSDESADTMEDNRKHNDQSGTAVPRLNLACLKQEQTPSVVAQSVQAIEVDFDRLKSPKSPEAKRHMIGSIDTIDTLGNSCDGASSDGSDAWDDDSEDDVISEDGIHGQDEGSCDSQEKGVRIIANHNGVKEASVLPLNLACLKHDRLPTFGNSDESADTFEDYRKHNDLSGTAVPRLSLACLKQEQELSGVVQSVQAVEADLDLSESQKSPEAKRHAFGSIDTIDTLGNSCDDASSGGSDDCDDDSVEDTISEDGVCIPWGGDELPKEWEYYAHHDTVDKIDTVDEISDEWDEWFQGPDGMPPSWLRQASWDDWLCSEDAQLYTISEGEEPVGDSFHGPSYFPMTHRAGPEFFQLTARGGSISPRTDHNDSFRMPDLETDVPGAISDSVDEEMCLLSFQLY
jgi:hypothetical protein